MIIRTSRKKCRILKDNRSAERPFEKAGISSQDVLKDNADYIFKKVQFMMHEITNGQGVYAKNYSKSTKRVQYTHLRGYLEKQINNFSHYSTESVKMLNQLLNQLQSDPWKIYLEYRTD
mgnify:CR=1 FL=1